MAKLALAKNQAAIDAICGNDDELETAVRQVVEKTADLKMRAIFKLYDKDLTGSLDSAEFTKLLQKCGVTLGKAQYQKLLKLLSGGDGLIDYKDFSKFTRAFREETDAKSAAEKADIKAGQKREKAAFAAMLAQREAGKKKAKEVAKGPRASEGSGGGGKRETQSAGEKNKGLEKLWGKIGKYIDKETGGGNKAEGMKLFETLFERYDANGDGELTIEELAEGLAASGITTSRKNFKLLLAEVDADGSGYIDLKEWTKGGDGKV